MRADSWHKAKWTSQCPADNLLDGESKFANVSPVYGMPHNILASLTRFETSSIVCVVKEGFCILKGARARKPSNLVIPQNTSIKIVELEGF